MRGEHDIRQNMSIIIGNQLWISKELCILYLFKFLTATPTNRSWDQKYKMDGSILWPIMSYSNAIFTDKVSFLSSKSKVLCAICNVDLDARNTR